MSVPILPEGDLWKSPEKSPVYGAFNTLCDFERSLQDQELGEYLTFLESVFDEGPRLKAIKDTFKRMFWDNAYKSTNNRASLFAGLAREIGDMEADHAIVQLYGCSRAYIGHFDTYLEGQRPTTAKKLKEPQKAE